MDFFYHRAVVTTTTTITTTTMMELESALPIVLDTLTRSAKRLQLACTIVQNKKDCTGIALLTLLAGSTVLIGLLACSLIYSWKSDY